jgi:amino acid permease
LAGAGLAATALLAGADGFFVTAALLALALPATGFAALVAIKDSIK